MIILFHRCRFNASHKILFLDAAKMRLDEMATVAQRVFDCDPYSLRLARWDAAVDIPGISIQWVRSHVRVERKRWLKEVGFRENSGGTLYFGRGGDSIRIYDKRTERMVAYDRMRRKHEKQSLPTFEEFSGIAPTELQVVRFERQFRSGRIPTQLATLREMKQNVGMFNPFTPVVFQKGGKPELKIEDYSMRKYQEGDQLRKSITRSGLGETWIVFNIRFGGNARRKMQQLTDFVPPDPEGFAFPDLFTHYRDSVSHQLGIIAVPTQDDPKALSLPIRLNRSQQ